MPCRRFAVEVPWWQEASARRRGRARASWDRGHDPAPARDRARAWNRAGTSRISPRLRDRSPRSRGPARLTIIRLRQSYARPGRAGDDLAWARAVLTKRGISADGLARAGEDLEPLEPLADPDDDAATSGSRWCRRSLRTRARCSGRFRASRCPSSIAHDEGRALIAADRRRGPLRGHRGAVPRDGDSRSLICSANGSAGPTSCSRSACPIARHRAARRRSLMSWRVPTVAPDDRATLDTFVADLPGGSRTSPLAACPTPWSMATSIPGIVRGEWLDLTILDWGDSGVGHPLLDQPAFLERMPAALAPGVEAHWAASGSAPFLAPIRRARHAAGAGRGGPAGGDLPDVPRQHRAQRARLSRHRSALWLTRTAELVRRGLS